MKIRQWEYLREIFKFVFLGIVVVGLSVISYLVLRRRGLDKRIDGNIDALRGGTVRASNWSRDIADRTEEIGDGIDNIAEGADEIENGSNRIESGADKIRRANQRLGKLIENLRATDRDPGLG